MSQRETYFLTFLLDHHRFAIPVEDVEKVERAVAITPVPESGKLLHGVIDYHGTLLPVINLRQKFSLDPTEITPDHKLLIVSTHLRQLAILVDEVGEVTKIPEKEIFETKTAAARLSKNDESGRNLLFNDKNGIVILYELESLLSGELDNEINQLQEVLSEKK